MSDNAESNSTMTPQQYLGTSRHFSRRNFNKESDFIFIYCEITDLNLCTTVCNLTLIYDFLRTVLYFWLKYQFINCVDNMSTHNAEPFENQPDSVSIPAEDPK